MFFLIRLFFIMSGFISLLIRRIVHQGSRVDLTPFQVLIYCPDIFLKKLCHLFLRQPDGLIVHSRLNPYAVIIGLVEQKFSYFRKIFCHDSPALLKYIINPSPEA